MLVLLLYLTLHPTILSFPSLVASHTPCRVSSLLARKTFNFAMNALRSHARYCNNNTNLEQTYARMHVRIALKLALGDLHGLIMAAFTVTWTS